MIIYSKKIVKFIDDIKLRIKDVLSKEVGLKVAGDRFYDKAHQNSYPIRVVIFNHKAHLGYFDPNFYELGFHESLMQQPKDKILQIIRHEIAHYVTFMSFPAAQPHGKEFKDFCKRMGWGKEVYEATVCLEGAEEGTSEESAILRKVQKLMALSKSSNAHEAELAMVKSQQLLLKHNIELDPSLPEEKIILKRIFEMRRTSPKTDAIARILGTFFVNIVYSKAKEFTYIEVLGTVVNVEIAEYVATFLDGELDRLWELTRATSPHLSGLVARNSFFTGLARGYCQKVGDLQKTHTKALVAINEKLNEAKSMVYNGLRLKSSYRGHCSESATKGQQAGCKLTISPAVATPTKTSALLGHIGSF